MRKYKQLLLKLWEKLSAIVINISRELLVLRKKKKKIIGNHIEIKTKGKRERE